MRNFKILIVLIFCGSLLTKSSSAQKNEPSTQSVYIPDDKALYDTILKLDSTFFHLYNTCNINLQQYADFYSDSIEFFHARVDSALQKKIL